jgi:acetoin utilization deacetylase AcuC-like enzyme
MPKDALLHSRLKNAGAERIFRPEPAERADLLLCHSAAFVDGFLNGTLPPKEMRRIGLPWSPELVRRTLVGVGSAVLAARLATQLGLAITTNGGTHHAHPHHGSGFCIFNDLAVAARKAQRDGLASRCFFVDLDVHQGDGTAAIFHDDPSVFTLSLHCKEQAFPEVFPGDMDVGLPAGAGDAAYLAALAESLPRAWGEFEERSRRQAEEEEDDDDQGKPVPPVLALYNAGVDVHKDDDLGKLALTDQGIAARDRFVLDFFASRGVPLCAAIGGGYNLRDHGAIVERHLHLHAAAGEMFGRFAAAADARRQAAAEARRRERQRAAAAAPV